LCKVQFVVFPSHLGMFYSCLHRFLPLPLDSYCIIMYKPIYYAIYLGILIFEEFSEDSILA
jgi:hypothetical protein